MALTQVYSDERQSGAISNLLSKIAKTTPNLIEKVNELRTNNLFSIVTSAALAKAMQATKKNKSAEKTKINSDSDKNSNVVSIDSYRKPIIGKWTSEVVNGTINFAANMTTSTGKSTANARMKKLSDTKSESKDIAIPVGGWSQYIDPEKKYKDERKKRSRRKTNYIC